MTKAIVCGSRYGGSQVAVFDALSEMFDRGVFGSVVEGGARGIDAIARQWARNRNVPCDTVTADWKTHGRAAGPIRNRAMLEAGASLVIAFPGGVGTEDMKRQARERGVRVIEVDAFGRWG